MSRRFQPHGKCPHCGARLRIRISTREIHHAGEICEGMRREGERLRDERTGAITNGVVKALREVQESHPENPIVSHVIDRLQRR